MNHRPTAEPINLVVRGAGRLALPLAVLLGLGLTLSDPATAQQQCRGEKEWYAGKCRYPDEITRMKAAQARIRARAKKRAQDAAACDKAKKTDTAAAWTEYLDAYPKGQCKEQAERRKRELEAKPAPVPVPTAPPTAVPTAIPTAVPTAIPTVVPPTEPTTTSTPSLPPPPPEPPEQPTEQDQGIPTLSWVGFGVAGAALAVGTATGIASLLETSKLKDSCTDDVCLPEQQDDIDHAKALGHASTVSFILAGAGLATGLVTLFVVNNEPDDAVATIMPLRVNVGFGAFSLTGKF